MPSSKPRRRGPKSAPESIRKWQRTKALSSLRREAATALVHVVSHEGDPETQLQALEACSEVLEAFLCARASEAQLQELRKEFPSLALPEPGADVPSCPEGTNTLEEP